MKCENLNKTNFWRGNSMLCGEEQCKYCVVCEWRRYCHYLFYESLMKVRRIIELRNFEKCRWRSPHIWKVLRPRLELFVSMSTWAMGWPRSFRIPLVHQLFARKPGLVKFPKCVDKCGKWTRGGIEPEKRFLSPRPSRFPPRVHLLRPLEEGRLRSLCQLVFCYENNHKMNCEPSW